jgi:site-specific recombinase XerD
VAGFGVIAEEVRAALKSHRHLRGPLVFCDVDGHMLTKGELKSPLVNACRRAGLRHVGWHKLRHSFASHLAMRGAPLKAIQELMGHSTIQMTMRYAHLAPDAFTGDHARLGALMPVEPVKVSSIAARS